MKGVNDLQTLYPLIALEWDEEKNGQKKPDMYTKGSNVKVWWKCINGHVWERSINDNVRRNGRCPVCKKKI